MATPARADRLSVADLMRFAAEGRIRIPPFQRPMRWERSNKQELLDSIERGYPVGTLLFWKRRSGDADLGNPLPGAPPTPPAGDVLMLIDGQQRTATLWEALGRPRVEGEWAMLFEPQKGFVYRKLRGSDLEPAAASSAPPAMPLFHALDATTLSEWVPSWLSRDDKRRYFEIGQRLREFLIPIYTVEGDDLDVLREVFDRVNSTGKSLSREDVFHALVGSRIGRGDTSGLAVINSACERSGFGVIEESTLLKVFEAVRGDDVGKVNVRKLEDLAAVEADLERSSKALQLAIGFLQNIGVPHNNVLPYELPLLVVARFFALHPEPSQRTRTLLRRWFWRGCLTERLAGSSGTLQQHIDAVTPTSEHASVQQLLALTGAGREIYSNLAELNIETALLSFSAKTAKAKCVLCGLYARAPRSLVDGEKLTAPDLFGAGAAEALRSLHKPDSWVANRLLHPKVLGASALRLVLECEDEAALLSHDIAGAALDHLRGERMQPFSEARAALQREHLKRFFDRQAEWTRDDSAPVQAIASGAAG